MKSHLNKRLLLCLLALAMLLAASTALAEGPAVSADESHYEWKNSGDMHWAVDPETGEEVEGTYEEHRSYCGDRSACAVCGVSADVAYVKEAHLESNMERIHNNEDCYVRCAVCDVYTFGPFESAQHCENPGVCYFCGEPYTGDIYLHYVDDIYYAYDETTHWSVCSRCGREVGYSWEPMEHFTFEGDPEGVCSACGAVYGEVKAPSLKVVALTASASTAKVGDTLTFTTQFEGEGEIAWIEYHIYDMNGNHLTGYRGEGSGISGVYHYPTANTGAGKYVARVYLMAQDGTFTVVDSAPVTVTAGTRKAVALNASATTARVGDTLTFTTQFEGDGPIAWIEYHIYDMYGNHLTGYRGEGAGISGVYHYPTVNTGAGKYTARVYLMAQDGTFTHVDSVQVTVTE